MPKVKDAVKSTSSNGADNKLTEKQHLFCRKYIETGNASEAYRQAYNAANMKPETVNRSAKDLMDTPKITAIIEELRAEHKKRHNITVDDLLAELEEARLIALNAKTPQSASAVAATMGKAKILGYDKQLIDVTTNGESMQPSIITRVIVDSKDGNQD